MSGGFNPGDICNRNGCDGIIYEHPPREECECSFMGAMAPCWACENRRALCSGCDWDELEEHKRDRFVDQQVAKSRITLTTEETDIIRDILEQQSP